MKAVTQSEKHLEKNKNDLPNSESKHLSLEKKTGGTKNNLRTRIVCTTLRADF